jgi:hypothetical protein
MSEESAEFDYELMETVRKRKKERGWDDYVEDDYDV